MASLPLDNPHGLVVAADGTQYVAETARHQVLKVETNGTVTVLAGVTDTAGNVDGLPGTGTLSSPQGLALDAATSTLWVADSGNNSVRQINITTGAISSTAAITGLLNPVDVALNTTTVFVLEKGAHRIKRRAKSGGAVTLLAGSATGLSGSTATTFNAPEGLAINAAGTLLTVADTGNHCIRRVTIPASGVGTITVWSGALNSPEKVAGLPTVARFNAPTAVAVDANGGVWVADTGNLGLKLVANTGLTSENATGQVMSEYSDGGDLRSVAIGPDGSIHAGVHGSGMKKYQQTATVITAEVPYAVRKRTDPLPASGRINSSVGWGDYWIRPDGTNVTSGIGYASFNTVKSATATNNTFTMAGHLLDGTAVTCSSIVTAWDGLPFHFTSAGAGSWQTSFQGTPSLSIITDFWGSPIDVQTLGMSDAYMRKTPHPASTSGVNLLDRGVPEIFMSITGWEYRSLAYYNQSVGIDTTVTPNASFNAWVNASPMPWEFSISQPVRFTTTAITVPAPNTNTLSFTLDAATGIVTGGFTPVGMPAATVNGMLIPFHGGQGSYLQNSIQSGPFIFSW